MIPMEQQLLDLFARLSRSSARNRLHAMRAKKDGRDDLVRLFLAIAESQAMQAQRFLMQIRGTVKATGENEEVVFSDELPAAIEEFATLAREAREKEYRALATGFEQSAEIDRLLLALHNTFADLEPGTDLFVCDFCGYIATGEPPEKCPICTAPINRFQNIEP